MKLFHEKEGALFLQLDRELIDLGRHNKIVFRQARDVVRAEFDRHVAIAPQVQA